MGIFKTKIKSSELAQLLFQLVLADEKRPSPLLQVEHWKEMPEFKQNVYSKQIFVYLVASVTFSLAQFYSKYPRAAEVQFEFRRSVINEMKSRWGYSEEKTDDEVEEAITEYKNLVFTDPAQDRGISIKWAQNWIKKMGIEEFNLMVLTGIYSNWMIQFTHLVKYLKEVL